MKIGTKIVLVICLLTILSISVSGGVYYFSVKQSLGDRIGSQLESVATLKKNQYTDFIDRSTKDLESLAQNPDVINELLKLDAPNASSSNAGIKSHLTIDKQLAEALITRNDFFEFFIVNLDRQVIKSTDQTQIGKFKSGEPYFNKGKKATFVQAFYFDTALQKPAITLATPVLRPDGTTLAVLAGRLNIETISKLMTERSGLGNSGETYLVNALNLIVSEVKGEKEAALNQAIYTEGVKACLNKQNGYGYYDNYQKIPVIGFHEWIPDRGVCLMAEISQDEALAPVNDLRKVIILSSIGIQLAVIFIGTVISMEMTKPIRLLRDAAEKIKQGELNTRINIKSNDEIGQLADSFNQMAINLQSSYSALEQKVKERTIELEETKHKIETINYDLEQRVRLRTEELEKLKSSLEKNVAERTDQLSQAMLDQNNTLSLLAATIDSTADGILAVDRNGKIESYNKSFTELWQIPNEVIEPKDDQKLLDFVKDQLTNPEEFLAKVKDLYAHPDQKSLDILAFKDGRVYERNSQPQMLDDNIIGRVWSFKNVSKQYEVTKELENRADELERMNKLMIGRELRMADLKDEIKSLKERNLIG
jgi:adenylate cyclase